MEPNFVMTGDQARVLMAALRTSPLAVPMSVSLDLYMQLAAIAQVQPPKTEQENEG